MRNLIERMAQFLTLAGRKQRVKNIEDYRIDWDDSSLSKAQWKVKQFLREFWERGHVVYEELPVVGTRYRLDFYNATRRIAVEYDGEQHTDFNPHFHLNRIGYLRQIGRDHKKGQWCEKNGIDLIRIFPADLRELSEEWVALNYEGLKL